MRWAKAIGVALVGFVFAAEAVRAQQGSPTRGRALAQQWCAKCHSIAPGTQSPEPGIPSFMRMAADPENTAEALRQFITLPHFEMPPQTLTRAEIDDVIAYILSLRR
jgi:mono/diheme cytochrome c family protein